MKRVDRSAPLVSVPAPRSAKAIATAAKNMRYMLGAAGRKWNAMDGGQRYELLLGELYPCEATSKLDPAEMAAASQGSQGPDRDPDDPRA